MTLNEEKNRMRILAGINQKPEEVFLNEGILANLAAGLGLTIASLYSVMAQTNNTNIDKLKYNKDTKEVLEKAMENPEVQSKLKELGVKDNNINMQIRMLKGEKITGYEPKTTTSEKELKLFMRQGYHLTSAESHIVFDTLKKEVPSTIIESIQLKMNEESLFESGKFQISQIDIQNIKSTLDSINESKSVLLKISIISSTDKQKLSPRLQNTLKSLGYLPDNLGLSNARNNGVGDVLKSLGVDSSIISQNALAEQGEGIINPSARYVVVIFDVVKYSPKIPEMEPLIKSTVNSTYNLLRPKIKGHAKGEGGNLSHCEVPILKLKKHVSPIKCSFKPTR